MTDEELCAKLAEVGFAGDYSRAKRFLEIGSKLKEVVIKEEKSSQALWLEEFFRSKGINCKELNST